MRINTFILFVTVFLVLNCNLFCQNNGHSSLHLFADSLFESSVDNGFIAGAGVLVMKDGQVLLDKSYGFGSIELGVPVPLHASFEIGSVTKQFTSTAILKLVEMGELSLDDDFTQYLDFDTKGRKITIGQLMDHTSGIASYTEIPEFWSLSVQNLDRDTLVRMVEESGFLFEPGEALIYNNSAYFFLGLIIEKVSGKSYEDFLSSEIFSPLGMDDTYYCSNSDVIKNKVYGYGYSPDGLRQKAYLDHTWPYAAGSLCSTTKDLLIWLRSIHSWKFLSSDQYKSLVTPGKLNDGSSVHYAKGIVNYDNFGHSMIGHGGGINGFLSDTRCFPKDDLHIISLVNTTGPKGASFFSEQLTWHLLEKNEHELKEIPSNLKIDGTYTGQARGEAVKIKIEAIPDGFTMEVEGEELDTVKNYIGENTWMNGNDILTLAKDELHMDVIYNYYIFKKQ